MAVRPVPEGGSRASASPAYERVPPHSVEAEESVLGSMLLSKDAIAEVLELLREDDFYRPAHRTVFRSVLELYSHGGAVDAITVAEDLRRNGALADVGGAPFLHTLVAGVPTAANAAYYARIVKEAGVLRRLIDVGTRIVQVGYETPQDVERAVDLAESWVYQVAQGRVSEDYQSLRDVLTGTLDAIERLHEDHRELTGVPTGFPGLDRLTAGLQPSNLVIVAARPAVGKCLAADTVVMEATTGARMTIREFVQRGQAGEDLWLHTLGDDWRLQPVRPNAFLDNGVKPVVRLTTKSGRTVRATANHPFRTFDGWVQLERLQPGARIAVPRRVDRAVGPNGDTVPRTVWRQVRAAKGPLSWAEVSVRCGRPRNHNWHADEEDVGRDRLAVLAKALESEPLRRLADSDVLWDEVVRVEPDGVDQVYDLTIDGTHNFVANGIVVHNSTFGLDVARHASVRATVPTVVFSLEMSRTELVQRLMCAECTVDMQRLRTGRMEESDWTRLTRSLGKLADAPLYIDDSPGTTMMEIRAKCRRLKQRHGLGLVVVDYLQLMQPSRRFENRQQEVSEISRSLKLLAKELEVPVVAISQLSRQTESRSDRRPMLSDLRESGALEQDSDLVLFIYRDELYDPESVRKGEADLILAKHRNGPTDTVTVTFQGQYSRFAPMAARSL
jgi:replicative DNA helicase